jgi:hypothetical protein
MDGFELLREIRAPSTERGRQCAGYRDERLFHARSLNAGFQA